MNILLLYSVDRDECTDNLCGPHADECTNSDGSYTCTCKDGYESKNGTCIGQFYNTLYVATHGQDVLCHAFDIVNRM